MDALEKIGKPISRDPPKRTVTYTNCAGDEVTVGLITDGVYLSINGYLIEYDVTITNVTH